MTAHEDRAGEAARRVNESLIRSRVLSALDLWLTRDPSADARAGVRAVLRSADPDQYRDALLPGAAHPPPEEGGP